MIDDVSTRIHRLGERIQRLEPMPGAVTLLAVSKGHEAAQIKAAFKAGQRCFAESYVQEAITKQQSLEGYNIEWHFIGRVQGNKTRAVAERFDWVHSIDRARIARRLSDHRPASLPPLQCCLECRLDTDPGKGGIGVDELADLAELVDALPRLCLRGLMTVPAASDDPNHAIEVFTQLADCYTHLRRQFASLDTLSMGMTKDMEAAIAAGSTMVRLGTAIFGPRKGTPPILS